MQLLIGSCSGFCLASTEVCCILRNKLNFYVVPHENAGNPVIQKILIGYDRNDMSQMLKKHEYWSLGESSNKKKKI